MDMNPQLTEPELQLDDDCSSQGRPHLKRSPQLEDLDTTSVHTTAAAGATSSAETWHRTRSSQVGR